MILVMVIIIIMIRHPLYHPVRDGNETKNKSDGDRTNNR